MGDDLVARQDRIDRDRGRADDLFVERREIDAAGHYAINGQTLGATGVEALKTALQNATTQLALPLIINADGLPATNDASGTV